MEWQKLAAAWALLVSSLPLHVTVTGFCAAARASLPRAVAPLFNDSQFPQHLYSPRLPARQVASLGVMRYLAGGLDGARDLQARTNARRGCNRDCCVVGRASDNTHTHVLLCRPPVGRWRVDCRCHRACWKCSSCRRRVGVLHWRCRSARRGAACQDRKGLVEAA